MTDKLAIEYMNELFAIIVAKKNSITDVEKIIRIDFEKNVVFFLKDKGFDFEFIKNDYDVIHRYTITKQSKNFRQTWFENKAGHTIPDEQAKWEETVQKESYEPPRFKINPWNFEVKFEWWKSDNQNPTAHVWHPEQMTLEQFYNKHLKRTFKLI